MACHAKRRIIHVSSIWGLISIIEFLFMRKGIRVLRRYQNYGVNLNKNSVFFVTIDM